MTAYFTTPISRQICDSKFRYRDDDIIHDQGVSDTWRRVACALAPAAHLQMQAAIQPYIDNAISKTINIPVDLDFLVYRSVFESAYAMGLKGCTTFRPNPVTGSVLSSGLEAGARPHCCDIEREAD